MKKIIFAFSVLLFSTMVSAEPSTCSVPQTSCGNTDGQQGQTSGCSISCYDGATAQCSNGSLDANTCQMISDDSCTCAGGLPAGVPWQPPSSQCSQNATSCGDTQGHSGQTSGCSINCYNQTAVCTAGSFDTDCNQQSNDSCTCQ